MSSSPQRRPNDPPGPPAPFRKRWDDVGPRQGPLPESVAWGAVSTLMSGLIGFGLPAHLLDRWLGTDWIVLPGLLVGMAVALTVVWFRYGTDRSAARAPGASAEPPREQPREQH